MGVPKFFRWISERYPAISQLINESRIPEFDCFYLDMNGIIHNCTHKDSDTATTRMSEEAMFRAIFNYIEHLFANIKPKQLFFMAIDGVAPRAKMNQQRSRRFRTALDAERAREKAIADGVEMPKEPPFDSNCITPGTEFMAKLSEQLRYFVNRKVSEDSEWQGVEIVLSGHEVPGEGEHKIMEYIRQAKSQPGYDANRRHCLYGLDADLIMLGLLSHDPHFCLLREEVTFGRNNGKGSKELQHQNFYLLHLCMVREYLELEFQELKEPGVLPFPFDLERVIDDFILMAFFIGNDFLPNLPHVHINEGALALMFQLYKKILPKAGGYLNESGSINLPRLALLLDELKCVEDRAFEAEFDGARWFQELKAPSKIPAVTHKKGTLVISRSQRDLYRKVKKYITDCISSLDNSNPLELKSLSPEDRSFAQELATKLNLEWTTPEDSFGDRYVALALPIDLSEVSSANELSDLLPSVSRIYKKYDSAVVDDSHATSQGADPQAKYDEAFNTWKDEYYKSKMGWGRDNKPELRKMVRNYVQGLQWVLYYYYRGVASWPWFYQFHYSPMISDVQLGFDADFNFELGLPFRPFEQLMGVLPDRSKTIVPAAYRDLMYNPESPIIDFYPRDFKLDMNGKKVEWEAVVKIPFIEEDRLLGAMATRESLLSEDERKRNEFGYATVFTFDPDSDFLYMSPLPGVFPDVIHCRCTENIFDPPPMEGRDIYHGLVQGVQLGEQALAGFPSLRTLPNCASLDHHGVCVFQSESRNQSVVVTLTDVASRSLASQAKKKLGQNVFVGYPFLTEARVVKVSDEAFDYLPGATPNEPPMAVPHTHGQASAFHRSSDRLENHYSRKLGIITGPVEAVVHVELLKRMIKTPEGALIKEFAPNSLVESEFPAQAIVDNVFSPDSRFLEREAVPIQDEFPTESIAIFLGAFAYGQPARISGHSPEGRLDIEVFHTQMPTNYYTFARSLCLQADKQSSYVRLLDLAKTLNIRADVLNAIVSTVFVRSGRDAQKSNLGLNLKFDFHKQKILHYSRHRNDGWEFSADAITLINEYIREFPTLVSKLHQLVRRAGSRVFASVNHQATDLFTGDPEEEIHRIRSWIKSKTNERKLARVPLDAEQLDSIQVGILEAQTKNFPAFQPSPVTLRNVPRHALLKSDDAEQRLDNQHFALGDRIEYVLNSGSVPIGRLGTVVGITIQPHSLLLDVVFDMEFQAGTSLGGRCSDLHGQTVPSTAILNLTNRQFVALTKASSEQNQGPSQRQGQSQGQGQGRSQDENRNRNRFDSGKTFQARNGQVFKAAPPPPALDSSYSSIMRQKLSGAGWRGNGGDDLADSVQSRLNVNGKGSNSGRGGRGGRGGGGDGRGSVRGARAGGQGGAGGGGNAAGNRPVPSLVGLFTQNSSIGSYNAVPPPPSLTQGSTRGGGGGRGGRGHGRGGRGARSGSAAPAADGA